MMKTRRGREMTTKPESLTDSASTLKGGGLKESVWQSAASKIRVESARSRHDGMAEYILLVSPHSAVCCAHCFPCVARD